MRFNRFAILVFPITFLAAPASGAIGASVQSLKVVEKENNLVVDVQFDKNYTVSNLKPTYERNFIQFVLSSASMNAARQVSVKKGKTDKIFMYPYMPGIVRLRVIFNNSSDWAKGKVKVQSVSSKHVRVFVQDALAISKNIEPKVVTSKVVSPVENEEKSILQQVVAGTKDIDINNPDSIKEAFAKKPDEKSTQKPANDTQASLDEQKNSALPKDAELSSHLNNNLLKMILGFLGVLSLFLLSALFLKKYASKLKKLPFGKKERLIQVIATHYLGHKKSISLVKVTGEYMVVGVSNDGISLISRLGPEVNVEKYLEDRFWGGSFEKHLSAHVVDAEKEVRTEKIKGYDGVKDIASFFIQSSGKRSGQSDLEFLGGSNADASTNLDFDKTPAIKNDVSENAKKASIRTSIKERISGLKSLG